MNDNDESVRNLYRACTNFQKKIIPGNEGRVSK